MVKIPILNWITNILPEDNPIPIKIKIIIIENMIKEERTSLKMVGKNKNKLLKVVLRLLLSNLKLTLQIPATFKEIHKEDL